MTGQRREGTYDCTQCGTRHTWVARHENGSLVGMGDRPELTRRILAAFAAVTGHASLVQMREAAIPSPHPERAHVDHRTREGRAWTEAWLEATSIACGDLVDAGYLRVVEEPCGPGGEFPWGLAITDAGRVRLAEAETRAAP